MIRGVLRIGLVLGAAAAVAYALSRRRRADPPAPGWVEPDDDTCPPTHPVKAKLSSRIYHLPGMLHYERTKPDRCYLDAAAAERDGLRAAKR